MTLPTKFKESFKTALAMTIAYGIALSMDWDKPMWAGFAVAFISLATIGQSLNKGAMRMFGTLVAIAVALTLIALFPQQRWVFMVFLSIYVGFCAYMMAGPRHQYFWQVCGFVAVIVCMDAGPNPVDAFAIATERALQTGLGILVYSLVAFLLWPSNSHADFEASVRSLATTQRQLYAAYSGQMTRGGDSDAARDLRTQGVKQFMQFTQLLDATETETYEVWELRGLWRKYRSEVADLGETLERWRESFAEVSSLDLQALLPNLVAVEAEIELRLAEIERMLAGHSPERRPEAVEVAIDRSGVRDLSHFQRAAVAVTYGQLKHLESLTRTLFQTTSDIKGFGTLEVPPVESPQHRVRFVLDPERLLAANRVFTAMWIAYLLVIYVPAMPAGMTFVTMAAAMGIAVLTMPQLPVSKLVVPVCSSIVIAGILYVFVMPKLSSFLGLGTLLFVVTFSMCYVFAAPAQGLSRAFGIAIFVIVAGISNEQHYSFLAMANTALTFPMALLLFAIVAHIPVSPHPERSFLRLLRRFFRSCEYLTSTMRWDPERVPTPWQRWLREFHLRELGRLPRTLKTWAPRIAASSLHGAPPGQVDDLLARLSAIHFRMHELLAARSRAQAESLEKGLVEDIRAWRMAVQRTFSRLAREPSAGDADVFRAKLGEILKHLEHQVATVLDSARDEKFSVENAENFYRLLGAFRGMSEALINYTGSTSRIDWKRWREEPF